VKSARQKEDVPSAPRDTWQYTHKYGTDSHQTVAPFQWTHPFGTVIIASKKSRLSEVRVFPIRPNIASALWNISRVFISKKMHLRKMASQRNQHSVSCFFKLVQQYTGTSRRPTTPGLKCTHDRLKSNRGGLDFVSRHSHDQL